MEKIHKVYPHHQMQCFKWKENEQQHHNYKKKNSPCPSYKDETQTSKLLGSCPSKVNLPFPNLQSYNLHSKSSLRRVSIETASPFRCCDYSHGTVCQLEQKPDAHRTSSQYFQGARILKDSSLHPLDDTNKENCAKIPIESIQQQNAISSKMDCYQNKQSTTPYNTLKRQQFLERGSVPKKTLRNKKKYQTLLLQVLRKNPALLNKDLKYKPNVELENRDIPDNFYTALFTTLCCCLPLGVASLMLTFKVRKYLAACDHNMARKTSAKGRKLNITGILLGSCLIGVTIVVYVYVEDLWDNWLDVDYYAPRYPNY